MAVNRAEYIHNLLAQLDSPYNGAFRAFGGWGVAESGRGRCDGTPSKDGGGAAWNLFNTSMKMPGSTDFNSVPVQNYKSFADGIAATIKTLQESGHGYEGILEAIQVPNVSAQAVMEAIAASQWGTSLVGLGAGLSLYQDAKAIYNGISIGPQV